MKTQKQLIGAWGEEKAAQFLEQMGYSVIERNFSTRLGELDIIAWHQKPHHGDTLVFVEVKTRHGEDGSAERSVNPRKIHHLFQAARAFCVSKNINIETTPIQFEQISIYGEGEKQNIHHYIIPVD